MALRFPLEEPSVALEGPLHLCVPTPFPLLWSGSLFQEKQGTDSGFWEFGSFQYLIPLEARVGHPSQSRGMPLELICSPLQERKVRPREDRHLVLGQHSHLLVGVGVWAAGS